MKHPLILLINRCLEPTTHAVPSAHTVVEFSENLDVKEFINL